MPEYGERLPDKLRFIVLTHEMQSSKCKVQN